MCLLDSRNVTARWLDRSILPNEHNNKSIPWPRDSPGSNKLKHNGNSNFSLQYIRWQYNISTFTTLTSVHNTIVKYENPVMQKINCPHSVSWQWGYKNDYKRQRAKILNLWPLDALLWYVIWYYQTLITITSIVSVTSCSSHTQSEFSTSCGERNSGTS